jgi:hypothetical protein
MTIRNLGVVTHSAAVGGVSESKLDLVIAGACVIDAGGSINVNGKGYPAGYTIGNTTVGAITGISGASHGGLGRTAIGSTNQVYGSFIAPTALGSGSSPNSGSTSGGGAVRITAASLVVNGNITANGMGYGSGGSGGSIFLSVGSFSNTIYSRITASGYGGFSYQYNTSTSGGGGRIALYYDTGTVSLANLETAYNSDAMCGTIYVRQRSARSGTLILRGGLGIVPIFLGELYAQPGTQPKCPEDFTIQNTVPSSANLAGDPTVFDRDGDGMMCWEEVAAGTDAGKADSNGDGILDRDSLAMGIDALNPNHDGDGLSNAQELAKGTDPWRSDTDGDGVPDNADAWPLDPLRAFPPLPTGLPVITIDVPVGALPLN